MNREINKDDTRPLRLHLGCGTRYLEGYINIDHPSSEHTVQEGLVADRYADILTLEFPSGTVDEIRLHHVFEHFPRQIALALLCRWTDWLKPGGVLRIETPDVMSSAWELVLPWTTDRKRHQVVRHLFGSHEASWAVHWDGWYARRFKTTLKAIGYSTLEVQKNSWGALRNIEVTAVRGTQIFSLKGYEEIVEKLLKKSLVTYISRRSMRDIAESELVMLDVWMREWRAAYILVVDQEKRLCEWY